jgi:hypothetical protein
VLEAISLPRRIGVMRTTLKMKETMERSKMYKMKRKLYLEEIEKQIHKNKLSKLNLFLEKLRQIEIKTKEKIKIAINSNIRKNTELKMKEPKIRSKLNKNKTIEKEKDNMEIKTKKITKEETIIRDKSEKLVEM